MAGDAYKPVKRDVFEELRKGLSDLDNANVANLRLQLVGMGYDLQREED